MATKEETTEEGVRKRHAGVFYKAFYEGTVSDEDMAQLEKDRKIIEAKRKPSSPYSAQNVLWLIAAVVTFYFTDFLNVLRFDERVQRSWLFFGLLLILINVSIAAFMIIYLSMIKKINSDHWDLHYPAAIPIATGSFALGALCLIIALWPVWNILAPLILFTFLMFVVVIVAMMPAF